MGKRYLFLALALVLWYFGTIVAKAGEIGRPEPKAGISIDWGAFNEIEAILSEPDGILRGVASHYDYVLDSGWSSAGHYIAATRDFDRYQYLRVTNIENNKSVVVYTTDFGPMTCDDRIKASIDNKNCIERIIDLSQTAFSELAPLEVGLINVKIEKVAR